MGITDWSLEPVVAIVLSLGTKQVTKYCRGLWVIHVQALAHHYNLSHWYNRLIVIFKCNTSTYLKVVTVP